jgi:hypothetical protein
MAWPRWKAPQWKATHIITIKGPPRRRIRVMLTDDGPAYTRGEWNTYSSADFEREKESGEWLFQGRPFTGTIRRTR